MSLPLKISETIKTERYCQISKLNLFKVEQGVVWIVMRFSDLRLKVEKLTEHIKRWLSSYVL